MDYHRIYRDFIADRKGKPAPEGYTERHHILPRSLGGSDDPTNLITLTAEDHYFAHLLLAKWLGGSQWGGVHCMAGVSNKATDRRKLFTARYMVGVARRRFAEHKSAMMTGERREHRDRVATLYNEDGRTVTGSRTALALQTGLSIASVSRLCNRKQGRTPTGWFTYSDMAEQARSSKRSTGKRAASNVAGANARRVQRAECGSVYPSLTAASSAWGTNTSNIARAIRSSGNASGSRWAYA